MTPAERLLHRRILRRAARLEPDAARRLLAAYRIIRQGLSPDELVRAIQSGSVDRLISELLSDDQMRPAFSPLRALIDRAVLDAGGIWMAELPKRLQEGAFNILNPRVIEAAKELETRSVNRLEQGVRDTVLQRAVARLEEGRPPLVIAREIREVLGLAPNQEAAVRNFERMLREGDREALTRELRDHRFDATLKKALGARGQGLSEDQIRKMVDAYRRRMIAFNAETHARTIALDSQRIGQRLSWEDAIGRGLVDPLRIRRRRVAVDDSRTRPEHREIDGEEVGFYDRYSNGEMVPGDSSFNCRCVERIFVVQSVSLAA